MVIIPSSKAENLYVMSILQIAILKTKIPYSHAITFTVEKQGCQEGDKRDYVCPEAHVWCIQSLLYLPKILRIWNTYLSPSNTNILLIVGSKLIHSTWKFLNFWQSLGFKIWKSQLRFEVRFNMFTDSRFSCMWQTPLLHFNFYIIV